MSEAEDEPLQRAALQRFGELLRARAGALRREVAAHEDETAQMLERSRENVEDVADEAEARRGEEVRGAEALRDATELGDIEAALVRIDAGTYGDCLDCDTSIPLARLEANPSALRCIACQERFEASARRSAP